MSLTVNEVRIATPCGLDWSKMTRREANKRFCGECKKHVHDLSAMGADEARALLEGPSTEGLCVRYLADERGNIAFRPDVPTTRLKRAGLAAAAVAMPLTLTACMGSYSPPPQVPAEAMPTATAPVAPPPSSATAAASSTAPVAPPKPTLVVPSK